MKKATLLVCAISLNPTCVEAAACTNTDGKTADTADCDCGTAVCIANEKCTLATNSCEAVAVAACTMAKGAALDGTAASESAPCLCKSALSTDTGIVVTNKDTQFCKADVNTANAEIKTQACAVAGGGAVDGTAVSTAYPCLCKSDLTSDTGTVAETPQYYCKRDVNTAAATVKVGAPCAVAGGGAVDGTKLSTAYPCLCKSTAGTDTTGTTANANQLCKSNDNTANAVVKDYTSYQAFTYELLASCKEGLAVQTAAECEHAATKTNNLVWDSTATDSDGVPAGCYRDKTTPTKVLWNSHKTGSSTLATNEKMVCRVEPCPLITASASCTDTCYWAEGKCQAKKFATGAENSNTACETLGVNHAVIATEKACEDACRKNKFTLAVADADTTRPKGCYVEKADTVQCFWNSDAVGGESDAHKQMCEVATCHCANGEAKVGNDCTTGGDHCYSDSCKTDYTYGTDGTCTKTCSKITGDTAATACGDEPGCTYDATAKVCKDTAECTCTNGKPKTGAQCAAKTDGCASCNLGFKLDGKECKANEAGECADGKAPTGADILYDKTTVASYCASCTDTAKHTLHFDGGSNSLCKAACSTYETDTACNAADTGCNYDTTAKACKDNACECTNGQAVTGSHCKHETTATKKCAFCNAGYYLKADDTCAECKGATTEKDCLGDTPVRQKKATCAWDGKTKKCAKASSSSNDSGSISEARRSNGPIAWVFGSVICVFASLITH